MGGESHIFTIRLIVCSGLVFHPSDEHEHFVRFGQKIQSIRLKVEHEHAQPMYPKPSTTAPNDIKTNKQWPTPRLMYLYMLTLGQKQISTFL